MEEDVPAGETPATRRKTRHDTRKKPAPVNVNYRMAYVGTISFHDADGTALATRRYTAAAHESPTDRLVRGETWPRTLGDRFVVSTTRVSTLPSPSRVAVTQRDARLRAVGLPVGSGVTEGACQSVIKMRTNGSSQRWRPTGLEAVLTLRSMRRLPRFWANFARG